MHECSEGFSQSVVLTETHIHHLFTCHQVNERDTKRIPTLVLVAHTYKYAKRTTSFRRYLCDGQKIGGEDANIC